MLCKRRILLIDPSNSSRKLLHQQLGDLIPKLDIITCATGQEAITALKRFTFELIFTRSTLKDITLESLLSFVESSQKNLKTPLFLLGSENLNDDIIDLRALGVTAYFSDSDGYTGMLNYIQRFLQPVKGCTINLLYVDASATSALITQSILEKNDIVFRAVKSAGEAREYLSADTDQVNALDLLLIDHNTGIEQNGVELIHSIRTELGLNRDHLPALLITISPDEPDSLDFAHIFAAGTNDFITKPLAESDLIEKIYNLVHLKQQNQFILGSTADA